MLSSLSAVVVTPKKPFIDWVNWANTIQSMPELTAEYFLSDRLVVVIPKLPSLKESCEYLQEIWDDIS